MARALGMGMVLSRLVAPKEPSTLMICGRGPARHTGDEGSGG